MVTAKPSYNMELHRFEENSKYGYRDENENIVIPTKYEDAAEFVKDFAIVKYNGMYGVIDSSDAIIIDFACSAIEEHFLFFECKKHQENEHEIQVCWYNCNGTMLYVGKAKALSETLLCISNGKKYGVMSHDGNRIINCLYDEIVLKNELLIVLREDKIGLYDLCGNVILDAFCHSIESVEIENNPMSLGTTSFSDNWGTCYYPGYCKEYFFDPNGCRHYNDGSKHDLLFRRIITVRSVRTEWIAEKMISKPIYEIYCWRSVNDITKPMIISTGSSKMIFTKSEGILPNCEFDDIQQITQICYVVKKGELYGVYRVDTKALVVPIEYESIRFYGGHTVLLCKDGLWGAKSLGLDSNIFNILFKVSIPTTYSEIKILDDYQHFFGCKKKSSYSSDVFFTIVRSNGEELEEISELECNSQFTYIDSMHFLTSIGGKLGFVNLQGQKVIPFKYDEIVAREDGRFDVRISDRWGILTVDGFEDVRIKYSSPLPPQFDKEIIVKDAESECFGLLAPDGSEMIPTIYEHLLGSEDNGLFYFGCGGFEDEGHPTFFSGEINGALWGVVTCNGKRVIDAKYLNFKIQSGFIVAGRDGHYFPDDDNDDYNWYGSNFSGVYDLYNKEGELLIGGFREFEYDERNGVFIFFFGGEWKEYSAFDDDWNNIHITGYRFERGIDLWLILDKNLKTILRDKDGKPKQFEKGFLGKIDIKQENGSIKHVYNMPIELMAKGFSHVAINSIIINDSNSEYHKSQAVDIAIGKKTKLYSKIEQVTENLFYFADGNYVGITNINSDVLIGDCLLITYPVNNYILIGKKGTEGNYSVLLYNLDNLKQPVAVAIQNISEDDLVHHAEGHWLKMVVDTSLSGLKALIVPNSRFLENEFIDLVTTKEGTDYKFGSHDNSYFFSNDWRFNHDEENYGDGGNDWNDNGSLMDALDGEPDAYWNID